MEDALPQVVWRSPGGDTDASFVVAGREIDLKMPNLDEFGQFKAQTSAKVLLFLLFSLFLSKVVLIKLLVIIHV